MPAITTSAPPVTTPETLTPETLGVVSQLTRDSGVQSVQAYLLGALVVIALFLWLNKK